MKNNRTLITLTRPLDKNEWEICFSDIFNKMNLICLPLEWSRPFYGIELTSKQINDLIDFLQHTVKGCEDE